jgi:stage V sporulation protein S
MPGETDQEGKPIGLNSEIRYNQNHKRVKCFFLHVSHIRFRKSIQGATMQSTYPPELAPEEIASVERKTVDIIKVSARSRSTAVAGAIAGVVREHNRAEVQAIGAGAVNQAIKAIAIARGYLIDDHIDVIVIPFFTEVMIDDQERTAVRMVVEPR